MTSRVRRHLDANADEPLARCLSLGPDLGSSDEPGAPGSLAGMQRLFGPVRHYAWGSTTAIPQMLGLEPDGQPHAELWLGAHPSAPARLGRPDGEPLDRAVARDPERWLGPSVRQRFGDRLPFLLKVLAADAPLSLQVHPNAHQALEGFRSEEDAGIPVDAPTRNYKDPYHKPELIYALTRFEALSGFRQPEEALRDLEGLDVAGMEELRCRLTIDDPADALRDTVSWLLTAGEEPRRLASGLVSACRQRRATGRGSSTDALVSRLGQAYPGDPGIVVAVLLHHLVLEPGEAIHLAAGNVHAYLHGVGVELMAASDNVLRGGLTPKHVDVGELMQVIQFSPVPAPFLTPQSRDGRRVWAPDVEDFLLTEVCPDGGAVVVEAHGPRIVFCTAGRVSAAAADQEGKLSTGEAIAVAHVEGPLVLSGHGRAFVASVGSGT